MNYLEALIEGFRLGAGCCIVIAVVVVIVATIRNDVGAHCNPDGSFGVPVDN